MLERSHRLGFGVDPGDPVPRGTVRRARGAGDLTRHCAGTRLFDASSGLLRVGGDLRIPESDGHRPRPGPLPGEAIAAYLATPRSAKRMNDCPVMRQPKPPVCRASPARVVVLGKLTSRSLARSRANRIFPYRQPMTSRTIPGACPRASTLRPPVCRGSVPSALGAVFGRSGNPTTLRRLVLLKQITNAFPEEH